MNTSSKEPQRNHSKQSFELGKGNYKNPQTKQGNKR